LQPASCDNSQEERPPVKFGQKAEIVNAIQIKHFTVSKSTVPFLQPMIRQLLSGGHGSGIFRGQVCDY